MLFVYHIRISISPTLGTYEAVSLEAKIGLVGVKKPVADVDEESGNGSENASESDGVISSVLKELIEPTLNSTGDEGKNKMNSKRMNIINEIKEVCKSCCCQVLKNSGKQHCIEASQIVDQIKQVCANCCCKKDGPCVDPDKIIKTVQQMCSDCCCKKKGCVTEDLEKELKDFCECPIKDIKQDSTKAGQCSKECSECSCHKDSACCSKASILAAINELCPYDIVKNLVQMCSHCSECKTRSGSNPACDNKDANGGNICCGCNETAGHQCICCKKVEGKLQDCPCQCKYCKVRDDVTKFFKNKNTNGCKDCSEHDCFQWSLLLEALKKHCDCQKGTENCIKQIRDECKNRQCCNVSTIQSEIETLCNSCPCKKHKHCCDEGEIRTKVDEVIKQNCKCRTNKCCFDDIDKGKDLTGSNKATEQTILKNIAKEIFNYYKPPEPKTTGFIVLKSCQSKELKLCSNNDGNGQNSNERICVSSDNLKIYKEAFKDLKASTKISSAYVSEFHPNYKIMIAFQSVTLKFCDFCSNGNEDFKIDGFPVNQRFSMTIQYRSPTPFLDKAANWKNKSTDSDSETNEPHHALTYNSFQGTGPLMDTFNCSCSVPCDSFLGSSCGSECFAVSTMYLFIALFISHGYYIGFQSYLDAVQSGFSWPTQFDNVVNSVFWWIFLALRNGFKLLFGMYNMDILGVVSLEAKIGLVGVKKPVADVDEENGNGSESGSDLLEEILKELIDPTLNGGEENKMNSKRMNIIKEIKKVCQNCCCNKNEECLKASDISQAVTKFCANCCSKDPKCCDFTEVIEKLSEFCACHKSSLLEILKSLCCCDQVKMGCAKCFVLPNSKGISQPEFCEVDCDCKFCKIGQEIQSLSNIPHCSRHGCCQTFTCINESILYSKLDGFCSCKETKEALKQAIEDLSKNCKEKKCCDESKIKDAVQSVITEKCQCNKNVCCFKNISNGGDLAVEKTDKTTEKTILKNIAKAIFNYYKPPEPKTTGFIVLKSCDSKKLTLCSTNDGNGQNSNEHICVSSNNLKIYTEAFTNLKATGQVLSGLVSEFHPNSKIMIAFQSVTLKFCDFCSNGNEFKIDGFPVNRRFSMTIQYSSRTPFLDKAANWRNKSSEDGHHSLTYNSFEKSGPVIDYSNCSCSVPCDSFLGSSCGSECFAVSTMYLFIALFISHGYYIGFQSYLDAVQSGFSWPTQFDNAIKSVFCGCFLNAIGPSFFADDFSGGAVQSVRVLVAASGSPHRQVDFSIEQIGDLSVKFENRVLSLDSGSDCKLKVSLHAKINLVGVKWAQPDVSKENGDPEKGDSDSEITVINSAHNTMLDELISPDANSDSSKKSILDAKRQKIIEAIKEVCKSCCCNRKEDEFCIKPDDVSKAVKQVCANCCCKSTEPCVDSGKIIEHVNKLCVDCCCKKQDCCNTEGVLSQIGDFCVCLIKDAKEKLDDCTCSGCSSCQENCIDKQKLMKEIEQLCSCSEAKKELEQAPQKCSSCSGGSGCECCEAAKKQFESCPCMACNLKTAIDEIKGKDDSKCCNSSSCPCSGSDCRKRTDVLDALKTYCKCTTQRDELKKKIEKLCQSCKSKKCCDVNKIQNDIQKLCNSCPCKTHPKCCNEGEIEQKVEDVIQTKCTCKKNKCCFNGVKDANQSLNTTEKEKLKNIAKAIFKYFRPPIAHSTGVMTLKSTADIDLQFSSGSSSSQDNITVDAKNKNVLKIPKQAFKDLIASTKINQVKVTTFHKNTMLSIHFEEISLTFQKLNGTGFEIDGYPINGTFSMQLGYQPIGPFTKNSANMRKKTENEPKKHNLSWGISSNHPRIDPSKCSCSILSDPLFGTVFGAICLTISIVQFIIALFVSQGYYDGFQSYMDAVRSGFSWPTQYDNVASSIFWQGYPSTPTLGTYEAVSGCFLNAIGPSFFADAFSGGAVQAVRVQVASSGSSRQVDFSIEQIGDLSVKFENRVLSLDSNSVCSLKVSLAAKISLMGVKWAQPDVSKENGDPNESDSDNDSGNKAIKEAYNTMLEELVSPDANSDPGKKNILNQKRKKIIDAIKAVCKDCCCNMTAEQYCIKPTDVSDAVKQVCAQCCCKSSEPCVDSSKIMDEVKKLCQNCCCKKQDCCGTNEVLSQIGDFCVCLIKDAKEKLDDCTCSGCSACQENCIDKQKLMKEIEQLCSCSEAKKELEQAPQKCSSCSGGTCQCCQEAKKQFESCPCMACDLKTAIDEIKQDDGSNCCNNPSCSCSSDSGSNCRTKEAVLKALKTYCKCDTQRDELKKKIEKLCQSCKSKKCCDVSEIQSDIEKICNSCPCKTHPKCCNETQINEKVEKVIEKHCTCKKFKCCFKDITEGDLTKHSKEQAKLKKIALAIFKYFRPPIAHSTGVMTLKSTTETELEFSSGSSSGDDKITVDSSKNVLKIPKQAFKDLMASSQIPQVKVTTFHKNTMLSIHFEEISLTFQKLNGTGFEIDGYPINGTFLMQLGYQPIGPYTKNTANWRKKTENEPKKHDLSWDISSNHPQIDKNKCSCSILSNPLFGTVFGAICLTISIVQFIIALFVSQGYYDGFQSYMDAVRSGFSWPTQYDNVVNSVFWWLWIGVRNGSRLLLGLYKTDILVVVC
ncbi:hypothetical protein BdWA1_000004 [Babesia duncani]|uniref:Uncharacterized protein n=1 Tax=Babesia duncani TaxID=323732 RepID=A0AAD9PLR4_9APIC|nr:hypothetical protein BdWA1_000004 [Babesia duncani]